MKRIRIIRWWTPGSFVSESSVERLSTEATAPNAVQRKSGSRAYAFDIGWQTIASTPSGEELSGAMEWDDGRRYLGGSILTLADIPDDQDNRILRSNMECNGWRSVIRTRFGQTFPFKTGDTYSPEPF